MKAVYKRELKSYFTSVTGWLFLAAFFVIYNLYFFSYNLSYGYPYISYSLGSVAFIFIIIVPILTMRSMAEDRKTKTDQLLYTAPVPIVKVILGKYLAMVTVLSIALGAVCLCPPFLRIFGKVPMAESYVAVLGIWLYGCLTIAVGLFLSSVTESQVIAAVLSFALLFVGYMMESITGMLSSSGNLLTKVLNCLSISSALDNFNQGILDVAGIIFYVSASGLFLFLTCQLVQKHRWSVSSKKIRRGVYNSSFVVIGIAIVVAVNLFANQLPEKVKSIDMTYQNLYSLTSDTKKAMKSIDKDITIYVLSSEKSADSVVKKTLDQYQDLSSHLKVKYVDPAVSPNFYATYTDTAPTDGSLIVVSGKQSKVIDASEIYEYETDYTTYSQTKSAYDGEGQITSAISYVTSENLAKVYCIQGHGESDLGSNFTKALEKQNISVENLTLLKSDSIPSDAAAIIINGPTSDFSKDDAKKIKKYLSGGGKALITTSYSAANNMKQFDSVLAAYDIKVTSGIVMEQDSNHYYQYPFYLLPNVESSDLTSSVDQYVFIPYAQTVSNTKENTDNLTWTELLTTSEKAYIKTDVQNMTSYQKESGDASGTFTLAANVTDSKTNAQVTVVAATMAFTDDADSIVSGQNLALFKGITSTYSGSETSVSIDSKSYTMGNLTVNKAVTAAAGSILIVVLPAALIIVGIFVWLRRRRA